MSNTLITLENCTNELLGVRFSDDEKEVLVDSIHVAKIFGKEHKTVIRTIRELEGVFTKLCIPLEDLGIAEVEYVHEQNGQIYKKFVMNRDGFSLLAMGFTGKETLQWKLKYIQAFNRMEEALRTLNKQLVEQEKNKLLLEKK